MHRSVRPSIFVTAGAVVLASLTAASPASAAAGPVINEFSASTIGTDVEYIELLAAAGTDLSGHRVLEIEGDSPVLGVVDGVFTPGAADASGRVLLSLPSNELENGTVSLLLVTGTIPALGSDIDANDDGTIDAAGLTVVDAVAVNDGGATDRTYGGVSLGVMYDGLPFAPGGASRIPDGTDTDAAADWVRNDFDLAGVTDVGSTPIFGEALNTPGAANAAVPKPDAPVGDADCTASTVSIGSVQGSGAASPVGGAVVRIEGTVVADFQTTDLDGFYLQDAGDGDPATSDGIFVYQQDADDAPGNGDGIIDVSVGDIVSVAGAVSEFQSLTEVTAADTEVCQSGAALPAAVALTLPLEDSAREAVEGMRVTFAQPLWIGEYFEFGRFNTVTVSPSRQFTPTAVVEPGAPAQALAAANIAAQLIIDDARGRQNPDPLIHPNGAPYSLANPFRGGDVLSDVTGILDQRIRTGDSPQISSYGIQPTQGAGFDFVNPRPRVPVVGGDLKVSSFNVLNYFTTLGSRGANTAEELERQQAKIVAALAAINADVFGLMEIENNGGADVPAVETLAAALNAHLGSDVYSYIDTGQAIGTDVIATAFLYKTATVSPLGDPEWEIDDPRWATDRNRPPLTQTFQAAAGGEPVTISVNHLKSKGSACGAGDPDTGDGQAECNLTRENAALALVDWLAGDPTGQGTGDRTLIIGDLNSYDKEDPIDVFTAAGYTDLLLAYQGEYAYSYVFDGQLGYLDHALAGPGLVGDVTGASTWAINADEPQVLDYNVEFKPASQVTGLYAPDPFRSSDHDPVLIGIDIEEPDTTAPVLKVTPSQRWIVVPNNTLRTIKVSVKATDDSGEPVTVELVQTKASGAKKAEIVKVNDTTFRVRAANKAVYTFTYKATDAAGNSTTATAKVVVGTAGLG